MPRRPLTILLAGGAVAALLLGQASAALAAPAVPPVPRAPLVTLDQAFAALPDAHVLPGAVRLSLKLETPGSAQLSLCPETLATTPVKGSQVGADYTTARTATPAAKTASWALSAVVFHTDKAAGTAASVLSKAERACPRKASSQDNEEGLPFARLTGSAYAVDGWRGYRSVDELSVLDLIDGPDPEGVRLTSVYLFKGNVMLEIEESGSITAGTAARQNAWRQVVTRLMLAQFDAIG